MTIGEIMDIEFEIAKQLMKPQNRQLYVTLWREFKRIRTIQPIEARKPYHEELKRKIQNGISQQDSTQ